jgi:hypothetical protein
VATPSDTLAVGGNFLTSCGLQMHLAVAAMESRLKVSPSCCYPAFRQLMWAAGQLLLRRLQQQQQSASGADLFACELQGLPMLVDALQQWLTAGEQQQQASSAEVPQEVPDPAGGGQERRGWW